jgi:hypothetical protein
MNQRPLLVDVTDLAMAVGFAYTTEDRAVADWLISNDRAPQQEIPIYFTQLLWHSLGGADGGQQAFHERATLILRAAHQTVLQSIIKGHAWRAGIQVTGNTSPLNLILIVGHSYSDGIAIGYGSGDFWA